MPKFDNLPQFFEELKLKEEATLTLQELIAQFKQQIPINYVEINLEEGNYMCSTNPKWKDKPLCERYFFIYQEKEIQLDIPHSLLEKLGLKKGEDITQPLYLDPRVLEKTETYKGLTVQEGEFIIVNPNKLAMKDQEVQTDLNSVKIKELEDTIAEQAKRIQAKDQEIVDLRNQLNEKKQELKKWTDTFPNELPSQVNNRISNLANRYTRFLTDIRKSMNAFVVNPELRQENEIISIISDINITYQPLRNFCMKLYEKTKFVSERLQQLGSSATEQQIKDLYNEFLRDVPDVIDRVPYKEKISKFLNIDNTPIFSMTKIYTATFLSYLKKEKGWWNRWIENTENIANPLNCNQLGFIDPKTKGINKWINFQISNGGLKEEIRTKFYEHYWDKTQT